MKPRCGHRAGLALGAIVLGAAPQPAVAAPPPDPFDESGPSDVGIEPGEASDAPPPREDDAAADVPPPAAGDEQPLPADDPPDVGPADDPPAGQGVQPAPVPAQPPPAPATTPAPAPPAAPPAASRPSHSAPPAAAPRARPKPHRPQVRRAIPAPAPTTTASAAAPVPSRTPPPSRELAVGSSYRVQPGDSLWSISAARLGPGASAARIAHEVDRIWSLNRDRIASGDPDLIHVAERLRLD